MKEIRFNSSDLTNGVLLIGGVRPGEGNVFDSLGNQHDIKQKPYSSVNGDFGVILDFNGVEMGSGTWFFRYEADDAETPEGYTGEIIHNFIPRLHYDVPSVEFIINEMIYPQIWMFCEIMAHYEVANIEADGKFHFSYRHWNREYVPQVFLNGGTIPLAAESYTVNYDEGSITPKFNASSGDNIICTYNFTWFKPETLISYVYRSISTINFHGQGATTSYTVDDLPESMWGVSADLCVAMAMENLILSTTMWYGKLIFAISGNDLYNGGGDIGSQLETIKRNCEDRAYAQLENDKMRAPNYLAKPTPAYWRSVSLGNGLRPGPHGQMSYGKTHGKKYNHGVGMTGPDLGL